MPGFPGRRVQSAETGRLRELPRERMLAPARADQEHLHRARVYSRRVSRAARRRITAHMSANDPGLELHEWETRWQEIEQSLADDPEGALPEACDLIEETLLVEDGNDEVATAYRAARETADRVERGEDVDPGDVGAAVDEPAVDPRRSERRDLRRLKARRPPRRAPGRAARPCRPARTGTSSSRSTSSTYARAAVGQIGERGALVERLAPARDGLHHRRRVVEVALVRREVRRLGAVGKPVANAHLELVEDGEDVELRQRKRRDPVQADGVAESDEIEPARPPAAAGDRAVLLPELTHAARDRRPPSRSGTARRRRASRTPSRRRPPRRSASARSRSPSPRPRHRVRRGHERIRAVVEVEERALRAFEQHALAVERAPGARGGTCPPRMGAAACA